MVHKFFFLVVTTLILVACSDNGDSSSSALQNFTSQFEIAATRWGLALPENWKKISPPQGSEAVFLARKKTENFVILRKGGATPNLAKEIYKSAQSDFFLFEEGNFTLEQWSFQAKLKPSSPMRRYLQKIFVIPETSFYLLGTCSYEVKLGTADDCETILRSWEISVDKAHKES